MKNSLLIPSKYKVLGWITFLLFTGLGLTCMYAEFKIPGLQLKLPEAQELMDFNDYNLTNELALTGVVIGLLMIAFAKEKNEDEYISILRLRSWQWSVLFSYVVLIVIVFSAYGTTFFAVLFYNVFTVPLLFIAKFQYSMYQLRKGAVDEN